MKFTRISVIAAALLCSFNIMAASQQLQRFSVMLTNNPNFVRANVVGTWELDVKTSSMPPYIVQNVTCNGGTCPSSISSNQTISIEADSTAGGPPSFSIKETSPTYTAFNGWKCKDSYIYDMNSPGHDMNAVIPMLVGTLNPPNYSYVTTSTSCTPH